MPTTAHASHSKNFLGASLVAVPAILVGGGLWLGLSDTDGDTDCGNDPFRNAVSDKRAPRTTVKVRDDGAQAVAIIAYDASSDRIPDRGTTVYLQTLNDDAWATTHSLSSHKLDSAGDHVVECVPEMVTADAVTGSGPDIYPLPDLDAENTYRICLGFTVARSTEATGCSVPFHDG